MNKNILIISTLLAASLTASAQNGNTDKSLFWKKDGVQVSEIVSKEAVQYKEVGHHGPAVENAYAAFRIYFNNSGAIDVYSKSGRGMELAKYKWYPSEEQQKENYLGIDQYKAGNTVGLGGIALWDGEKEVKLVATKGRTARVGDTPKGCYAEMIAYGVEYCGSLVDISIRIDVTQKSRLATVTATELNGKRVRFLTGVNYHKGEQLYIAHNAVGVWGVHPADVARDPKPVGAALFYDKSNFTDAVQTDDMLRIISKPSKSVTTTILAASTLEAEMNSASRFEAFFKANSKEIVDPEQVALQKEAKQKEKAELKEEKARQKAQEKQQKKEDKEGKKIKKH